MRKKFLHCYQKHHILYIFFYWINYTNIFFDRHSFTSTIFLHIVHKYILLYCSIKQSPYYLFTFFVKGQMYPNSPSSVWKTCMCVCVTSAQVWQRQPCRKQVDCDGCRRLSLFGDSSEDLLTFFVRGRGKWRRSLFVQRKEVSRMRSTCRGYNYLPARVCICVCFSSLPRTVGFFFYGLDESPGNMEDSP